MVNSKRYNPTIERFRKHTQGFVSGKTKKGHLDDKKEDDKNSKKEEGILVRIDKRKINDNGWRVKVGNKTYDCSYGDNISYRPDCVETGHYLVPKKQCKVEVSINKKSKIYTITKILGKKNTIEMTNKSITLKGGGDAGLKVNEDNVSVNGDIQIDTKNDDDYPDDYISIKDMYKRIQDLELQIDNTPDDDEEEDDDE